jgi:spore maturation protein CgeB
MRSRDQFRANVVFAGRATPHRERFLSTLVGFGLALWGPGWRRTSLRDYCRGERLGMEDYVRAYAGAFVGVNIHREDPALAGEGCNRRLFELAAIGVPQAVDESGDLTRHFTPETEVLFYRGESELKELVRLMLESPKETAVVAEQARRRALSEHTLMHRLTVLLHEVLVTQPLGGASRAPGSAPPQPPPEPPRSPYTLHR